MRVYDTKNLKYQDKLAEKRRRVWILKTLFFVGLVIAVVGFILYLLFFSGFLEIKDVSIKGLEKVSSDEFNDKLDKRLNLKWLGLLEYQRSVVFFDSDNFKSEMLAVFPEIKDISVSKKLPHALNITVTERKTAGVWCFVESCKYFDREGFTWGEAARSSGFLILEVDDMRQGIQEMVRQDSPQVDRELLASVMLISERLEEEGIFINKFTIPDNSLGDFSAFTSGGYELMFSADSDIRSQLGVLEIFLAEKESGTLKEESPTPFNSQYIDLRINGRIYYK